MNTSLNTTLDTEIDALIGDDRSDRIKDTLDKYNDLIKNNIYIGSKPVNVSAKNAFNSILGGLIGDKTGEKINTGNPARDEFLNNRTSLERIFTGTDSQVASYFLSTNSNIVHICDEIESICTYMYQLEEAVDIMRDHVVTCEDINEDIAVTITFPSTVDEVTASKYTLIVKNAMRDSGVHKKLRDHVIPKSIKFGTCYLMIIPYSEIGVKMMTKDLTAKLVEGTTYDSIINDIENLYKPIGESVDTEDSYIPEQLLENLNNIYVCESDTPPNVMGIGSEDFGKMPEDLQDMVRKAMRNQKVQKIHGHKNIKPEDVNFADGTVDPTKLDEIPGCYIKSVDPRQIIPIKVMDCIIGYYYFENYDYSKMGTTLSDIMSNNVNFNDRNVVIDNIVNTILKRLKYGDLIAGDDNFKNLILNCVLYAERRSNPLRIKFVPTDYVIPYATNIDEEGNGRPVLLKSLFFGRLYVSLLLFLVTTIVTKSTDTEFYYLKENALNNTQFPNQVDDLINQFRESNIDPLMIANGNLLHGNRAVNKRYFMSTGTNDIKPFEVELMSGQNVDTHTEFLNDLKKMAISSTGIPSVGVDLVDEVDYATMYTMSNIKTLKRTNNIKSDMDIPYTETAKRVVRYNKPNAIPDDILEGMTCTFNKSKIIQNNLTADGFNNAQQIAKAMVETYFEVDGREVSPLDQLKINKIAKQITIQMTPSLPWGMINEYEDSSLISAKQSQLDDKINSEDNQPSENVEDMY